MEHWELLGCLEELETPGNISSTHLVWNLQRSSAAGQCVSVTEWKQNISDVCQMKTGLIRQKLADKRTNGRVV